MMALTRHVKFPFLNTVESGTVIMFAAAYHTVQHIISHKQKTLFYYKHT